jgi:hypothetical protein
MRHVDHSVMDRRHDTRFLPPLLRLTRATLRPGYVVSLVDLSAGGALVEGPRPLRPGARVHLQVLTDSRVFALVGHVLRCVVWSLDPQAGVTYRGALKFEHRCELFWEGRTLTGSAVPGLPKPTTADSGQAIPSGPGRPRAVPRRHTK